MRLHLNMKSEFVRHVMTLLTGTTIAQVINLAMSPMLARLYSPAEFGVLALYLAVLGMIGVLACGRYELAILLPERDADALHVMVLSSCLAVLVGGLTCVTVCALHGEMLALLKNDDISFWIYCLPISVVLTGVYQALYNWSNRRKEYRLIASSRIYQSVVIAAVSIGLGFVKFGPGGLVLGWILGQTVATSMLGLQFLKGGKDIAKITIREIVKQAKIYVVFPKYSIAGASMNAAANQVPLILLSTYFGASIVGLFAMTQRVLWAPIALVSSSICDVFKQRASSDYATYGNCRDVFVRTLKRLLVISALPFTLLLIFAPQVFVLLFGAAWREAGVYAQIMTVLFFLGFAASPLSYLLSIAQKLHYDLVWQITLFISTTLSIVIGHWLGSARASITLFTASYSLLYIIYLYMSYSCSKGERWRVSYEHIACEAS